ncbi:ribosomal protein 63, mitochondrial [Erpetoichthys calabaricus]|uniref:Mitochondrial ribosomal protein L57 n=1 Tax=Erpetoichthys calabaricus TaxID=27687 RepID=A0A8C4T1D5_ERPCA|nr:ribosomal protein 63, mitochondrial [Erpetoichthys calabaricus]
MFLTLALFRKGIPGKQWIGKYRRPRQITWQMKRNLIEKLEVEAENEYWLSRAYMTKEQEKGHATEYRLQRWATLKASQIKSFPGHRHVGDHLNQLNVSKKWTIP